MWIQFLHRNEVVGLDGIYKSSLGNLIQHLLFLFLLFSSAMLGSGLAGTIIPSPFKATIGTESKRREARISKGNCRCRM